MIINHYKICYLFGSSFYYQIGNNDNKNVFIPFKIQSIQIINGSLGLAHTLLLTDDNNIYSFGSNKYYQCTQCYTEFIKIPYFLSKKEMNIDNNRFIENVIAGENYSIFIINSTRFIKSKNIKLSINKQIKKRKYLYHSM